MRKLFLVLTIASFGAGSLAGDGFNRPAADAQVIRRHRTSTGQDNANKLIAGPHPDRHGLGAFQDPGGQGKLPPQVHKSSASVPDLSQHRLSHAASTLSFSGTRSNQKPFTRLPAPAMINGSTLPAGHSTAVINGTNLKHRP